MGLCAPLDAILVRGARSLAGNQNGRTLGSLRRRFLGLLRFPVRFSLALGHHCLPALANSSVVLFRYRREAWKLAKLDRASRADTATESRDGSASMRVERGGKFDRDCNRLAVAPLTGTLQAMCKIFERSVLRQHE